MVFVQLLFPTWHFNGVGDQSKKFRKTGPDRKKLDRQNARQQPIKFKDFRKKYNIVFNVILGQAP